MLTATTSCHGLWVRLPTGPAVGGAEATSDDPRQRRRNRSSPNTVKPIQAEAAKKIRINDAVVLMTQFRCGPKALACTVLKGY
jgi:hypothetical protein